ncbi:MAG: DUF3427 domain-containing protein [Coriobacteriia bacterium]|nr:DUF3427 domain-containing protein [Coriobacteriia bacterium]
MEDFFKPEGIYEEIISIQSEKDLIAQESTENYQIIATNPMIDEALPAIEKHLSKVLDKSIKIINANTASYSAEHKYNEIIESLSQIAGDPKLNDEQVSVPLRRLDAVVSQKKQAPKRPITSLITTSLFTGTAGIKVGDEIRREIASADTIDLLISFIKLSGLNLIIGALQEFTQTKKLRVITTSYMGATDAKAVEMLSKLPNTEIKVSYDTKSARLHAKAYIFHRNSGYSTAFIGSSNMSSPAMNSGLEWNVRVTKQETPHIIDTASIAFETYWNDPNFFEYEVERLNAALGNTNPFSIDTIGLLPNITPFPFQRTILNELEAERSIHGHYRNLLVAATGTGKTVISAFDYKRFVEKHPDGKLLFIAHRVEILEHARSVFRLVLKDNDFGEIAAEGKIPENFDHLFLSIQTLNSKKFLDSIDPKYYDFVIIDEFHHAASISYQDLLKHVQPQILLGLTATPERMDGKNVQELYFEGRIAAEIRLPEAINKELLVPFDYYFVNDETDLTGLRFNLGKYSTHDLEGLYTADDKRVRIIAKSLADYIDNPNSVKALGFCVSVAHAEYMSKKFNELGLKSAVIHGMTPKDTRERLPKKLAQGEINYLFSVDVFNEGIDIPEVDTILFLRPTESLTVFLQQLGRGLRLHEDKKVLTVLDYVGQASEKYRFEDKIRALLDRPTVPLRQQAEMNSFCLPSGCNITLDKISQTIILSNIETTIMNTSKLQKLINAYIQSGGALNIADFLEINPDVMLSNIYEPTSSIPFYARAKSPNVPKKILQVEARLLKRIAQIDSSQELNFLIERTAASLQKPYAEKDHLFISMLYYSHKTVSPIAEGFRTTTEWFESILSNNNLRSEIQDLAKYLKMHLSFIGESIKLSFQNTLQLHSSYTRGELLASLGYHTEAKFKSHREGVLNIPDKNIDIFLVTLDKNEKTFSETTSYKDYAISSTIFHWQSQSGTTADCPTGLRYQNQHKNGGDVLLFIRETKDDRYINLGMVSYISHTGSKPMSILWKLDEPMPEQILRPALAVEVG